MARLLDRNALLAQTGDTTEVTNVLNELLALRVNLELMQEVDDLSLAYFGNFNQLLYRTVKLHADAAPGVVFDPI